jgi:hypothetical protein
MRFARWVFLISGLYGLLALVPGYFTVGQITPPLNHPEYFYGFYGCALAWQFAFFVIAGNPVKYRMLMPIAVFEKLSFFVPGLWLYETHRLAAGGPFLGSMIDGVWMVLFAIAWLRTPKAD